jgi:hypothetical protein
MKMFCKESQCFATAAVVACGYVLFMHFGFGESWSNSYLVMCVAKKMATIIPAIGKLRHDGVHYTNYWGAFFSFFWIISPIYWVFGFLGAPVLSVDRYKKLVVNTTILRVVVIFFLFSTGVAYLLTFPILNGMLVFNQVSDFFPVLLLSWWLVAGVIYYHALVLRVLVIKINI